jgi:hypothetical protein
MDYLITNGKVYCSIKLKQSADGVPLSQRPSTSLPKLVQFRCSKPPTPNSQYEMEFSAWVTPLRIQSVTERYNGNYVVEALVLGPIERSNDHVEIVPGAAYLGVYIAIKWPSGNFSGWQWRGIEAAIRLFSERVNRVPPTEFELASGRMEGRTRAPHGGFRRVKLATWKRTEPLAGFFQAARTAWARRFHRPVGSK